MVTPLSKIKDVAEPKVTEIFTLTLYSSGTMYIPKAMGGVYPDFRYHYEASTKEITVYIILWKDEEYKKHVYIPVRFMKALYNDRSKIKIDFKDTGRYWTADKETPEE